MAYLEYTATTSLFHYCGPGGFDGITQTGAIWLTDLQYANDPKELELATVIETLMLELIRDPNTPLDLRETYRNLAPSLQRVRVREGIHSFSLSLKGDQLPMWQEYTDRGRGFCIAFRATAFNDMPLRIQKVVYAKQEDLSSLHTRVQTMIQPIVGNNPNPIKIATTLAQILALITSVKDESWQHEDEVRLVFSSNVRPKDFEPGKSWPISQLPDGRMIFPEDPLYRERQGQQVPYFIKPFGRWRGGDTWDASGAIAQVIVGPNNTRPSDEVTASLKGLGYQNFEVVRSRCAFR